MAEFKARGRVEGHVVADLTYDEAKALEALACYGADAFIKAFYEKLGTSYLKPHEAGLRSLFDKATQHLPGISRRIEDADAVFKGHLTAIRPDDLKHLQDAAKPKGDPS